jgi:lipid-A-disaccharide synthase
VGDLVVYRGDFPHILTLCEAGVVAAGTASLEAAVVGLPIVVVYRMSPLSYLVGRTLVRLDDVALPNLVAGRRVVPELIQGECTAPAIERALAAYLDDPDHARRVRADLAEVRRSLGGPGVFDRAAEAVLAELDRPD